ncbi:uncharacterized protein LOC123545172 [Mercenaria mercenaria]|uniref:uncharacterized protein LOC123545172 n=1 Tax=Mercenaria mercenaria TaxID=6596 RepID=UPI00234EC50E|nr:uncharacterized protein LOC123545172 [Mercenaria mercenaria]
MRKVVHYRMNVLHAIGFAAVIYAVQASVYPDHVSDLLADLQYIYNIDQLQKTIPVSSYYPEDPYNDKIADDWDVVYPDTISDPKEPRDYGEAALRDQEYMKQLPISGYQFISGGTGKEDPVEVKTDKVLPAYCTPPNPCPFGYTGEDNCVKDFENTPEKNRQILEEQDCPCDAEHMLSCPPGKKTIDPKSGFVSDGMGSADNTDLGSLGSLGSADDLNLSENPYFSLDTKRQKLVAKKSPHFIKKRDNSERFQDMFPFNLEEDLDDVNPYFFGQPKSIASKKQAPDHMIK